MNLYESSSVRFSFLSISLDDLVQIFRQHMNFPPHFMSIGENRLESVINETNKECPQNRGGAGYKALFYRCQSNDGIITPD
ncbi:MAG: hypothetical protein FWG14_13150 [Peptococcaceae bacterium]|nr:hypothetical protein [Peptococcaceae bacterium]